MFPVGAPVSCCGKPTRVAPGFSAAGRKAHEERWRNARLLAAKGTDAASSAQDSDGASQIGGWPACSRRSANIAVAMLCQGCMLQLASPAPSLASTLGPMADRAWEAIGGGPADLVFPEEWLGAWSVTSVLVGVETPLGTDFVPNQVPVQRAIKEDLNAPIEYNVSFVRGPDGHVIFDRKHNLRMLLDAYYGDSLDLTDRITWDASNPNVLQLAMPNGLIMRTRVTRRSCKQMPGNRVETSEFLEELFDDGVSARPRVKATQCYTKYKWRSLQEAVAAGGPPIIATQVVSEYLTPDDEPAKYIRAMNQPVVVYTYRLAFRPSPPPVAVLAYQPM